MLDSPSILSNPPGPVCNHAEQPNPGPGFIFSRAAVRVRASSLAELFDCPARWEAKHIHGKYIPSSSRALLGKAIHKSTATFDQSTLEEKGMTIEESAAVAIDAIHQPEEDVLWEEEKPEDLEPIAISLHSKYCTEISPKQNYLAVEVQCDSLEISDLGLLLTGTTDRIRKTDSGLSIVDIKTGRAIVSKDGTLDVKGYAFQLGVYELLAAKASGFPITDFAQVVGMNTAKTKEGQRIALKEVAGARQILLGGDCTPGVLEDVSKIIHSGAFYGNPKSMMCHKNYCPIFNKCHYRK